MKEKILIVLLVILLIGLIALGLFTYNLYQHVEKDKTEAIGGTDKNIISKENEIKEEKMSELEAIALGKPLYEEAIDLIGKIMISDEYFVKMPANFDSEAYTEAKVSLQEFKDVTFKNFTEEYKEKALEDESPVGVISKFRVRDGKLYVLGVGRGRNMQYIGQDELEVVNITEDTIEFIVKVKYLKDGTMDKYVPDKIGVGDFSSYNFPEEDLDIRINQFILKKEDGTFKISRVLLPY